MNFLDSILQNLLQWLPFSMALFFGILVTFGYQKIVQIRAEHSVNGHKFYYQLALFLYFILFIITLVILTPLSEALKGQLLSLIGITFTAAMALSSTTFLGNIMAGLMLKVLGKYKVGDFLRIDLNFGRVTEMGFLHTEIQTQDRDLTTLPNLYLVTNPVRVIRSSGTIISEDITLGYDIHHNKIEKSLLKAASKTGLEEPFMHIQHLGDFSVQYRISGFLKEVKSILSVKAKLREQILDSLHADKIEIVSPTFMNQRVFDPSSSFIPQYEKQVSQQQVELPEDIIFDKAEEAETIEKIKEKVELLDSQIKETQQDAQLSDADKEAKINRINITKEHLVALIKQKSENIYDSENS